MKDLSKIISNYGTNLELSKFKSKINEEVVSGSQLEDLNANTSSIKTPVTNVQDTGTMGSANEFVKKLPAEMRAKIGGAIKRLANLPTPEEEKIAYYKLSGRNIKLEFQPLVVKNVPNAKRAMFTFLENPNRSLDLAQEMYRATAGVGTKEKVIFAIPAVIREYCENNKGDAHSEISKLIGAYKKKFNRDMITDIIDDMDEAENVNGRNILLAAFLINDRNQIDASTTGSHYIQNFLKKFNIDPANTQGIADMLDSDYSLIANQLFVLNCPKSVLLRIHYVLKAAPHNVDLFTNITANIKGDLKLAYKYKFMAANILPKDDVYTAMFSVMANGVGKKNIIEL